MTPSEYSVVAETSEYNQLIRLASQGANAVALRRSFSSSRPQKLCGFWHFSRRRPGRFDNNGNYAGTEADVARTRGPACPLLMSRFFAGPMVITPSRQTSKRFSDAASLT